MNFVIGFLSMIPNIFNFGQSFSASPSRIDYDEYSHNREMDSIRESLKSRNNEICEVNFDNRLNRLNDGEIFFSDVYIYFIESMMSLFLMYIAYEFILGCQKVSLNLTLSEIKIIEVCHHFSAHEFKGQTADDTHDIFNYLSDYNDFLRIASANICCFHRHLL